MSSGLLDELMKAENGGKQMKNVWRMAAPSKDEKRYGKHPTQKPLALVARCLRSSTNEDDLVFDPFSGSATTGVAALMLGRRFVGSEMDDKYVQIAARRLSDSIGRSAPGNGKGGKKNKGLGQGILRVF